MFLGTADITKSKESHQVAQRLIRSMKLLQDKIDTPVSIINLPPMTAPRHISATAVINSKLKSTDLRAQVVDIKDRMQSFLKDQLIGEDGFSLTEVGIKAIISAISEDVRPVKSDRSKSDIAKDTVHLGSDEVIEEVVRIPEESVGRIIGNKGVTIRSLQENSSTTINIQSFSRNGETFYAAFVKGNFNQRATAKHEIRQLIASKGVKRPSSDRSNTPPSNKAPK